MADAETREVVEKDEVGTWYEVFTDVWACGPYPDDVERDWQGFSASERGASWSYRTRNDRVRRVARALAQRRITLHQARADVVVARWLEERGESLREALELDEDAPGDELALNALLEIAIELDNEDGCCSAYYGIEDDRPPHDALQALKADLPAWARVEGREAGGCGSGYYQAVLFIARGHTLEGLCRWMWNRR